MTAPYQQSLLGRLDIIGSMGADALANVQQAAIQRAQQTQSSGMSGGMGGGGGNYIPAGGGNTFQNFLNAEARLESGGNYRARNASSGALGKYQIMPGNVGPWSQDILGRRISPQQFYNSPGLQEQIAQGMLRRYYNRYGPYGAAQAWYGGPGGVGKGYTNAYALKILRFMGLR